MAFQNWVLFANLTWQLECLVNNTESGLSTLNKQVHVNSEMTLLHQLALDMLLVKERGLCGYHKLYREQLCPYSKCD